MKKMAFVVALAIGPLTSTPPVQSQDGVAKQFVGTWRLVSWPQRLADGTTRRSPQSVGYIIYTDNNHVCYVNMDPNRPKWKSPTAPTESEEMSAMRGFGAYCANRSNHAGAARGSTGRQRTELRPQVQDPKHHRPPIPSRNQRI
jgi:hypothetical protein